jgi:hypothetical protein
VRPVPSLRPILALVAVLCAASAAWAQDYTTATTSNALESRPAGATKLNTLTSANDNVQTVDLPFEFPYFGRVFTQMTVGSHGYVLPGGNRTVLNAPWPYNNHGQDWTTGAFPYSLSGVGGTAADMDGIIAVLWNQFQNLNDSPSPLVGAAWTWTTGTAPSRKFVVSWESVNVHQGSDTRLVTVQVHFHESSGVITFAYTPPAAAAPTGYGDAAYVLGIDAFDDSRYVTPANGQNRTGAPSDRTFTPRSTTYTGRLRYDALASDATGIGNTTRADQDLSGVRIELRRDGSLLVGSTTTESNGNYSLKSLGVASTSTGSFVAIAQTPAARVLPASGSAPREWRFRTNESLAADGAFGISTLRSAEDANATLRASFHAALRCAAVRSWVASRTTDAVPLLDVVLDDVATVGTSYSPAGANPASLRIGGAASSNPDAWDAARLARAYARHVLASISASPTTPEDSRFDAKSDVQNAFAEAFGYALWIASGGTAAFTDGLGPSSAQSVDLESPTLAAPRTDENAGAVAAALHDLIDAANESGDTVDGTADPDRFLRLVDASATPLSAAAFLQAWVTAGYDGASITRAFVANGALADDASEPNDASDEAAALGPVGVKRTGLVLNRFNEDWFTVTLPSAVPALLADLNWDRATYAATVAFEIRNGAGSVVTSAVASGTGGPVRLQTGPLGAGTYRLAVRHQSGGTIPVYSVQAFTALTVPAKPVQDWTQDRPYDAPIGASGGVPPYTYQTLGSALPNGLLASSTTNRVSGRPTASGAYSATLEVRDSGSPVNSVLRSFTVQIAPPLRFPAAPFAAFAAGSPVARDFPHAGGTGPFVVSVVSGGLPPGLAFAPSGFGVSGTAPDAGSTALRLAATDVAGSAADFDGLAVVCGPGAAKASAAGLAPGRSACGWWVDAVQGSTLGFSVKTAPKNAKRTLSVTVLGPDREPVAGGKTKAGLGKAAGSAVPCGTSGRYFVVVSSEAGDAAQLVGAVTVKPPAGGRGADETFDADETAEVTFGALAGAKLVFKGKGDAKRGLTLRLAGLVDPDGNLVQTTDLVKASGTGFTLTATLPASGTWKVLLAARSDTGEPAKASWTWTVRNPKGAVYVAE